MDKWETNEHGQVMLSDEQIRELAREVCAGGRHAGVTMKPEEIQLQATLHFGFKPFARSYLPEQTVLKVQQLVATARSRVYLFDEPIPGEEPVITGEVERVYFEPQETREAHEELDLLDPNAVEVVQLTEEQARAAARTAVRQVGYWATDTIILQAAAYQACTKPEKVGMDSFHLVRRYINELEAGNE